MLALIVPDDGYFRNMSCALDLISTFFVFLSTKCCIKYIVKFWNAKVDRKWIKSSHIHEEHIHACSNFKYIFCNLDKFRYNICNYHIKKWSSIVRSLNISLQSARHVVDVLVLKSQQKTSRCHVKHKTQWTIVFHWESFSLFLIWKVIVFGRFSWN
jgi:hypothetical protein